MHLLTSTSQALEIITAAAGSVDWSASWVDFTTSATEPGSADGNVTTATTTTIVAAPGAATQRQVKEVTIYNAGTAAQAVTVQRDNSSANRVIIKVTLAAGESLTYTDGAGWQKASASASVAYGGYTVPLLKTGTGADAAAYRYFHYKDAGFPGSWTIGTPGMSGRTTDGTTSTDAGCLPIPNASTGENYLTRATIAATVAHYYTLYDVLWVQSGIVVTTTTAQTINSVAFPARDNEGTVNGKGCLIGLIVQVATTNGAVIANSTVSYTNSAGTAGHTATLTSGSGGLNIPATAVAGTLILFQLQAGDDGVQSIQSITLGTSLGAGTVNLCLLRTLIEVPVLLANIGQSIPTPIYPGVRLYDGTCALLAYLASATTATTTQASFQIVELA